MKLLIAVSGLALLVAGDGNSTSNEDWDYSNAPDQFASSPYTYNFTELPTEGRLQDEPWSDTYWPSYESGIAHRWSCGGPSEDFHYTLLTKEALLNATAEQIACLSPAEKYDIFIGRYDYPIVKSEWKRTSPDNAGWEGLCHGWAPAALVYKQPDAVTVNNTDGITITFHSSDVKAMLTYFMGQYNTRSETTFIGQRCNDDIDANPDEANEAECADMNAAAFHVVLANEIGRFKLGFVIDRDRGIQVWNQPLYSFSSTVSAPGPARVPEAASTVTVSTTIQFTQEVVPQEHSYPALLRRMRIDYYLDLDANNTIVGGAYTDPDGARADFSWRQSRPPFYGYFSRLGELYSSASGEPQLLETVTPLVPDFVIGDNGAFGTFAMRERDEQEMKSWSIPEAEGFDGVSITFDDFDTEKEWEVVKVYEGANGEGALVAVLHGSYEDPVSVTVHSSGALVVFKSWSKAESRGFIGTFTRLLAL